MPNFRMGWLPDRPDFRDYSIYNVIDDFEIKFIRNNLLNDDTLKRENGKQDIAQEQTSLVLLLKKLVTLLHDVESLPKSIDLRQWCSPIEDQGKLDSCTAQAGVALVEYFERKVMGEYIDASSLFLYKVTRKLMHLTGDTGASTRFTMKAMALFGIPPEEYWPYEIENFDEEPSAFCYAYAQNYQSLQYFRLDLPKFSKEEVLAQIKAFLAVEFPIMFGFTGYSSIFNQVTSKTGKIPYPIKGEKVLGSHSVVAVGYDDYKLIQHPSENYVTQGAFRIRNCWGENWGEDGYGWLPYNYVLQGLATDWWSLLKNEWVEEGQFGISKNSDLLGEDTDPKVAPTIPPKIAIIAKRK
ncbi:C1 family peptidase [Nostoc sp. WHI]|uniref:C1 family peptidase n=1 Tax=Nostoc sp. WHI TaxID=2650611 RepID=UPI0018C75E91|nr:C1 family peptidase [Nostoc sp. WHI]MBG1271028.1 cysteine protease [Nostoc sp. WHI]